MPSFAGTPRSSNGSTTSFRTRGTSPGSWRSTLGSCSSRPQAHRAAGTTVVRAKQIHSSAASQQEVELAATCHGRPCPHDRRRVYLGDSTRPRQARGGLGLIWKPARAGATLPILRPAVAFVSASTCASPSRSPRASPRAGSSRIPRSARKIGPLIRVRDGRCGAPRRARTGPERAKSTALRTPIQPASRGSVCGQTAVEDDKSTVTVVVTVPLTCGYS